MATFSQHLVGVKSRIEEWANLTSPSRPLDSILHDAQSMQGLSPESAACLMAWGQNPSCRMEIEAASREVREKSGGRTVEIIIPEYLTSFCQNDCLYCGYRKSNPLAERVRLTLGEFEKELDLLLAWGHRQIELVLADDPEFGPGRIAPYIELARRKLSEAGGGLVALNAPAYAAEGYRLLFNKGLDWLALWQETYDATHFGRWHFQGSPKREYAFRLDVWDRAIPAGFTRVALGVLFGLYDWRFDVLALIEHGNYLLRNYGIEPHALGIPRLKPARGVLASQKPSRFSVSDEDYRLALNIYHLAFPRPRLFLNTRETFELNLSLATRGDLFTVDCETLPGAYLRGRLPGQFSTHSYPPRREVQAALARQGYGCRYLEPEDASRIAASAAKARPVDLVADFEQRSREHQDARLRLRGWTASLAGLPATPMHLRGVAALELRNLLQYFETDYSEHCRREEQTFQLLQALAPKDTPEIDRLISDHERFAVDLDRFERQITSYHQSGDPTVLLAIGGRMISELGAHLDREDQFFKDWA